MDKSQINEIKRGESGTGLLIENDGYISLEDSNNKRLFESCMSINEETGMNEFHCPSPFIVSAVFQKFGIENANGRIYPEKVLRREVEKYQDKIRRKCAIGECYLPTAKILTETGWKQLSEVKIGEHVLTLNTESNKIELQPIVNIVKHEHDGNMIRVKSKNINDLVTPEHGFPLYNKDNKFVEFVEAKDLLSKNRSLFIPKISHEIGGNFKEFEASKKIKPSKNKGIHIDKACLIVEEEYYKGDVMCIEVPNHTWYVMDNGKCHWTKNCNHPSEITIDLSRVAINIIELHWERNTLVGKLEVLITEGFRRTGVVSTCGDEVANLLLHGIEIGVSSRGVGTVTQQMGVMMVGDDYEITCWDVVSDPSTPGAYIKMKPEELSQYVEEKNKKGPILNEKLEKLNDFSSWLND